MKEFSKRPKNSICAGTKWHPSFSEISLMKFRVCPLKNTWRPKFHTKTIYNSLSTGNEEKQNQQDSFSRIDDE